MRNSPRFIDNEKAQWKKVIREAAIKRFDRLSWYMLVAMLVALLTTIILAIMFAAPAVVAPVVLLETVPQIEAQSVRDAILPTTDTLPSIQCDRHKVVACDPLELAR